MITRRGVQSLVVILVLMIIIAPAFVSSESSEEAQRRILKDRYQELERLQEQLRTELGATQTEKQSLQKEVNQIRGQINYMESKIQSTETKIDLTNIEIGDIHENISETQKEIDVRRETVGNLIALRDQHDREGLLVNFIRFNSLSDFFQRLQDVVTVHTRLLALISELKGHRVALELDWMSLEDKKQSLEYLNQEQEHQQYGLVVAKSAKDKVLTETKGQESVYKDRIANIEHEKEALFKELRELELKIIHGGLYIVRIKATDIPPPGTHIFTRPDGWFTQSYGWTKYAKRGAYGGAAHNGVDIASGYGSSIRAIGSGIIVANGSNKGWGNWIAIQHANNMVSVYAHMSSLAVLSIGAKVSGGQVIGYEGSTGQSTGSHLHLSLYKEFFTYLNDKDDELYFNYFEGTVNPCSYMACK